MHKKEIISITVFLFLAAAIGYSYFNEGNITGFAVADNKENLNFYGTYSIKPSFKVNVDYDLEGEYSKIVEGLGHISDCAKLGSTVESCAEKLSETIYYSDYEWGLDCDAGAEKVFYDFAEFYQDCFDSEDDNCICELNLDYSEEEIKKYELEGEYKIKTELDNPRKIINLKLEEPEIDLRYAIKTNGIDNWNPGEFNINYKTNKKESAELIFEEEVTKNYYDIDKIDKLILYKFGTELQFIEYEDDKVIFFNGKEKEIEDLKTCSPKPKNIHKFCVTNKKKQFYVSDKIKNKVELKNPVIKFAAYIEDFSPPPVENIGVRDKLVDDNSVIIKWDKSKDNDVAKYNIYYGKSELNLFDEKLLSEIKRKQGFGKKELADDAEPIEIKALVLNNCEFDPEKKGCVYATGNPEGIILEKEKLYFFKEPLKEYYLYILPVEDNADYDFSVTAVDKNGNEIDNVKYNLPVKKGRSIDDLPISSNGLATAVEYRDGNFVFGYDFSMGKVNIDGTETDDFSSFKAYYKVYEYNPWIAAEIENEQEKLLDTKLSELSEYDSGAGMERGPQDFVVFAMVALDEDENPDADRFTLKQLGIESTLLYP